MRTKLLTLMVFTAALQLSCGGMEPPPGSPELGLETPVPDSLQTTSWPDAADLGVVVSSGIVPSEDLPPPPDFAR